MLLLCVCSATQAATINITTTNDGFVEDGECGLREAIQAANTNQVVGDCVAGDSDDVSVDELRVPAGTYVLTMVGAGENNNQVGDLDIRSSMSIIGDGPDQTIIDGGELDRVLHAASAGSVYLASLTIRAGLAPPNNEGGGAFFVNTDLTMEDCLVEDNHIEASVDLSGAWGGGVCQTGANTTTIRRCWFHNNSAADSATGRPGRGGGIQALGPTVIEDSTFSNNRAGNADEISGGAGGGIYATNLTMVNTTVTGNHAANGAGVYTGGTIAWSTIVDNVGAWRGGGIEMTFGADLSYSIVANNSAVEAADCFHEPTPTDVGPANLVSDESGCVLATGEGGIVATGALFAPLADSTYFPPTRAPIGTNPAIGAAAGVEDAPNDARGVLRSAVYADIGAHQTECGDGVLDSNEVCDDGEANSDSVPDACRSSCETAGCGDGVLDTGEVCDAGALNGEANRCAADCLGITVPVCGNGVVEDGEACDGADIGNSTYPCRADCRPGFCGDGIWDPVEACDDGVDNGNPHRCNTSCGGPTAAVVGNGAVEAGEACDDGNRDDGDGCSATGSVEEQWLCSQEPSMCAPDRDGDFVPDASDNCVSWSNADQADSDGDGVGDVCEAAPSTGCSHTARVRLSEQGWATIVFAMLALGRRRLRSVSR